MTRLKYIGYVRGLIFLHSKLRVITKFLTSSKFSKNLTYVRFLLNTKILQGLNWDSFFGVCRSVVY